MRLSSEEILRIAVILAVGEGCETSAEVVDWVRSRRDGLLKAGAAAYSKEQVASKVNELTQIGEIRLEEGLLVL